MNEMGFTLSDMGVMALLAFLVGFLIAVPTVEDEDDNGWS